MNRYLLCAALSLATVSQASADDYQVDPVHSSVVFSIKHSNVNSVFGLFADIKGNFSVDGTGKFDVSVGVDSINSGNEGRDKHLKSPDFFSAREYPRIRFTSKNIKKLADDSLEVTGEVTMRGVTRPMTAKIKTATGKGRDGGAIAGLEATIKVKRSDFKVGGPGLGDDVNVMISLQGKKQ